MSDLLRLPVDRSVSFDNASYKNPGRVVMRTQEDRIGWSVYYCMADGRFWWIGDTRPGSEGTAAVFGVGAQKDLGVNHRLAVENFGKADESEIHDAEFFYVFGVSPDGVTRTRVHRFHNDKYVPKRGDTGPPWKLQGNGVPDKVNGKRGIFDRYVELPPDYEPGGFDPPDAPEPDEPAPDPGPADPPRGEPGSLLATVQEIRSEYGTPLTNPEMGELLNRIAWAHRSEGWGLARKPTGARTQQPQTGIDVSRDLLIHRASGDTYDVLADVEGEGRPTFNYIETGILEWVAPVDPGGNDPVPDDPPVTPVPDEPQEPEEPDEPQGPEPVPSPEPRFTLVHAPPEVEAGELFRIAWATQHAAHVELDSSQGPIAHDLAASGSLEERLEQGETYVIRAVNGRQKAVDRFEVRVRPRQASWLDLLRRLLGW